MLIYNFQKEFIGIDEKDLISLGYKSLSQLKTEVADFADLFVKTPGYIHNFKHVHWIDFITCAESYEESRVIINVNNKNYKSNITITTVFLMDNPSQRAYIVNLNNLRELTHKESEAIANDIMERPANSFTQEPQNIFNTPELTEDFNEPAPKEEIGTQTITIDPYESDIDVDANANDTITIDVAETLPDYDAPLEIDIEEAFVDNVDDVVSIEPIEDIASSTSSAYTFDPTIASNELGLPLDLIEEFIQDFITQAREFKEPILTALDNGDLDRVKILSHKLKGVAANLRVEDALERLTLINTSSDINVIRENIDELYVIIAKLAGEEVALPHVATREEESFTLEFKEDEEDDLYSNSDDIVDVIDETFVTDEIPQKIETLTYSKEAIANEIGLDLQSFESLFRDYIQDAQLLTESISKAIQSGDYKTSQEEALRLRGMSDNMRINSFSTDLEKIIYSTDNNEVAEAISTIEANLAQLSQLGA